MTISDMLTINIAKEADLAQILDLQKLAYVQEASIYNNFDIPPLKQSFESIRVDLKKGVILKAVINETIVGSVRANLVNDTCYIGRLIVHPEFQDRGIGKQLMNMIEKEYAQAENYELFTGNKSEKNLHFYKSMGYREFKSEQLTDLLTLIYLRKFV